MMEIKKARFIKSITKMNAHPGGDYPEIAVSGKSNVGKSTLINYFCNQNKLAKTSGTPGKTRLVNFFLINEEFYLVDLPGYGYAKVSKEEQLSWGQMIEDYLIESRNLKAIIILVDIRHDPTKDDLMMFSWAAKYAIPVICVATKADKIAKSKRYNQAMAIRKFIGYGTGFDIFPVSASEKFGKEPVLEAMEAHIKR
jgi:GTP-binding protein